MMGLDDRRGAAKGGNGFDHIRIECSLAQKIDVFDFFCLGLENVHEYFADDFALFFRIGNTG